MTTTHIMSDETGQLILAQLQAISQALDDGALSNSQIDTVLADQSPTGAGFLDGGGLKRFFDGLQAQFADISHNHSGDALTPASVAATGTVSGSSISDGTGTLAQLRESVYPLTVNQAFDGITDCSFNGMVDNRPGWYVVTNNASSSPASGLYGNAFIAPMKSSNRIFAVAAFDDGSVWVMCGAGQSSQWVRVQQSVSSVRGGTMDCAFENPGGSNQLFTASATVINGSNQYYGKRASVVFCNDRIELYVWNRDGTAALVKTLCVASQ